MIGFVSDDEPAVVGKMVLWQN